MTQGTPSLTPHAQGKLVVLSPKDPLASELIQAQVQEILATPEFNRARRLSRFLRFAVERTLQDQPDQLKEYVLGVEVFDRHPSYDPHLDPIVRVEARRLRAKLAEYYEKAGQDGLVLISFPKGSYVPVFEKRAPVDYLVEAPRSTSDRQLLQKSKTWLLLGLVVGLIAILIVLWVYRFRKSEDQPEFTRLAADFIAMGRPALSWDGKLVTYASTQTGEGPLDIWVQQVAGGQPLNVTRHPATEVQPSFSPDGTQIVFNRGGSPSTRGIWVIPTFGGDARRISDFGSNPRFSPDGKRIAFDHGENNPIRSKVYLVSSNGGTPLKFLPGVVSALLPHWSPDGKLLLFWGCSDWNKDDVDLWVAPLDGGNAVKTGVRNKVEGLGFRDVFPGAWTPSGDGVIVWAERSNATDLLRVSLSAKTFQAIGVPQRLTRGTSEDCCPSVSSDGRMAFKSVTRKTEIVALPIDSKSAAQKGELREIAHGNFPSIRPSASADGKKAAYMIPQRTKWEVRFKDLENNAERTLVSDVQSVVVPHAVLRPDGMKVAFSAEENQKPSIYIIDTAPEETGRVERICENCGTPYDWSHDGTKILYVPYEQAKPWPVWMVRLDTRRKTELLRSETQDLFGAQFSPDDRWISFQSSASIYVVPFAEATLPQSNWIETASGGFADNSPCWATNGERLYFFGHRDEHVGPCIWAQRLHPLSKRPVGKPFGVFHNQAAHSDKMARHIGDFWMSQGGDQLFFSATKTTASIWMTQLKRP